MSALLYLLDTNIIVQYIRDSEVWRRIVAAHQPLTVTPTPLYCVVSEGELRSLALRWSWGSRKQEQLEFSLGFFQPKSIVDPEVMRMYAALDSHCESIGHKLGKNDLWIAATAAVAGATLLTSDRDFDFRSAASFAPDALARRSSRATATSTACRRNSPPASGSTPTPADRLPVDASPMRLLHFGRNPWPEER